MPFVVTEACIRCKYMECVDVCPVDCFHEGANMLVINPGECIDCGACVPACPAEAIYPDSFDVAKHWADLNARMAELWPVIVVQAKPPDDADAWNGMPDKYALWFSQSPGANRK
ncbi:MAG: ferredoxin FdxA [Dehalococcoidia bacterium]